MRLTELNPRWYVNEEGGPKVGLTFDCPCCRTRRLGVGFHHTAAEVLDAAEPNTHGPGNNLWQILGDDASGSFEHVTLLPSVDASKFGHWHGCVTDGDVV